MAEQTYLEKLRDIIGTGQATAQMQAAVNWFRSLIQNYGASGLRRTLSTETPSKILARHDEYSPAAYLGNMYFFFYNPKHKATLPWYDTFPLVFPVKKFSDGFLGLNLHYLAPKDRAILMDQLKEYTTNENYDETTKLRLTYNTIMGSSRLRRAKPTIHRYLNGKVKSQFIHISANEWESALFLPVERFKSQTQSVTNEMVWRHSRERF